MPNTQELMQGPVPGWVPTLKDQAVIEELLGSENDLDRAYGEVYRAGYFVKEFGGSDDEHGIAAVGETDKIAIVAFRLGKTTDEVINELTIADCFNLGTYPGQGSTRTERVRNGLTAALEQKEKDEDPDALDLFGSFTESGFKVDAYMPRNSQQALQWTVRVFKEGEDAPQREETIPMLHEPIFGVDVDDQATLEQRVDSLMQELTSSSV
jgi:hypothetical protein